MTTFGLEFGSHRQRERVDTVIVKTRRGRVADVPHLGHVVFVNLELDLDADAATPVSGPAAPDGGSDRDFGAVPTIDLVLACLETVEDESGWARFV